MSDYAAARVSDYATARAIRDASRSLVLAITICSVFVVIVLPITSVVVVHQAAKWKIETMQSDFQRGLDEAAAERAETPSR